MVYRMVIPLYVFDVGKHLGGGNADLVLLFSFVLIVLHSELCI